MLILPIKRKWFDMILKGEKKEEYREEKPYYRTRFYHAGLIDSNGITTLRPVNVVFRNGYGTNDPSLYAQVVMKHGYGKKEWGAEEGKAYYCLEIVRLYKLDVNNETVWKSLKNEFGEQL